MKIAVYAIALNEARFVERCIESAKDADCFILADTGSTDETVNIAKKNGAQVYSISINPWRFDNARNAALALVPADVDVCIALDIDEVLEKGWRKEVERIFKDDITRLSYKFDWGSGIVFYSDKIHSRKGYSWKHACHEVLTPDSRIKEVFAKTDMQLITHLPDNTKSRSQYLDLLKVAIIESPNDQRTALYYARELMFNNMFEEAAQSLKYYLSLDGTDYERAYAMRLLASASEKSEDKIYWLRLNCSEYPTIRENWVHLAKLCYNLGLWAECFNAAYYAIGINTKPMTYTSEPESWGSLAYDLTAISSWHLGIKENAIKYGKQAVEIEPNNDRLIQNLKFYES